jgi:prolyl oligopeptidase
MSVRLTAGLLAFLAAACAHTLVVPTDRRPVVLEYHGVKVTDDYQWLEDWNDPVVRAWSEKQNVYARGVLDKLPRVAAIHEEVTEFMRKMPPSYSQLACRQEKLFAMKFQPPLDHPLLVVMPSADRPQEEKVLVDPNQLDKKGASAIDWYVPSPDGKIVAVSMSRGGSESGDVHLFEVETGKKLDQVIPRVNGGTAGGDLDWTPDGSGFYYTRYPREGERPAEDMSFFQQLWFHRLGTPGSDDRYEIGKELPRIAEIKMKTDDAGRVVVTVQYGDSGRFAIYLREGDGNWSRIADYDDGVIHADFGPGQSLYLISRKEAPRGKVLRLTLAEPDLSKASVVVPEGKDTISARFWSTGQVLVTKDRLYLTYQLGGPAEIRAFGHQGKPLKSPEILPVSRVGSMLALNDGSVLYTNTSFIQPGAWYRFDPAKGTTEKTALFADYGLDFADTEVVREFATSRDGTRVPVNIIKKKGIRLDGSHPLVLYGYGGYGSSLAPFFNPLFRIWLDHGFVLAYANLRGGGEFGEEWHRAGMLTNKQNVFDDFFAVMQLLVKRRYTSAERLALRGASNGGLLMGAMITQHPKAFAATVSHVGIYDMLRVELSPNGRFNIPEFGTVKEPDQFKAMYAYSPYHRVKDGVDYPAVLFMTGANDPRVDPMQSRKMTARLQAASSGKPVLLRTSGETGHGSGTPLTERIGQIADDMAFIFHQLGVEFRPGR